MRIFKIKILNLALTDMNWVNFFIKICINFKYLFKYEEKFYYYIITKQI